MFFFIIASLLVMEYGTCIHFVTMYKIWKNPNYSCSLIEEISFCFVPVKLRINPMTALNA